MNKVQEKAIHADPTFQAAAAAVETIQREYGPALQAAQAAEAAALATDPAYQAASKAADAVLDRLALAKTEYNRAYKAALILAQERERAQE